MNFLCSCRDIKRQVLCDANIALFVLVYEWSELKDAAYDMTDIILLILQGIQAAADNKVRCALFKVQRGLLRVQCVFTMIDVCAVFAHI